MTVTRAKLNQKVAAGIGTVTAETWFWDTDIKGFHIRARPGVPPVWGIRYVHEGAKRTKVIGPCHEIKAERARERALEIKSTARVEGIDLVAVARAKINAPTIADLAREHLEIQKPPKISPAYYRDKKTHWNTHIIPVLGKVRVTDLCKADIEKFHGRFADQPALANSLLATLSKALGDCVDFKPAWRSDNPCARIEKFTVGERQRILSMDEAERIFAKVRELKARTDNYPTWAIPWLVELLLLTGLRLRELANRRWKEIDLEHGTLTIPKPKAKKKARNVSLSHQALQVLEEMPKRSEWVFPNSLGTGPFASPQKHWMKIREELELADVRVHDLRHTVASYAHKSGLSQREVMELLGHSQMSTTERYLNVHDEQKRGISDRASAAIVSLTRRPLIEAAE